MPFCFSTFQIPDRNIVGLCRLFQNRSLLVFFCWCRFGIYDSRNWLRPLYGVKTHRSVKNKQCLKHKYHLLLVKALCTCDIYLNNTSFSLISILLSHLSPSTFFLLYQHFHIYSYLHHINNVLYVVNQHFSGSRLLVNFVGVICNISVIQGRERGAVTKVAFCVLRESPSLQWYLECAKSYDISGCVANEPLQITLSFSWPCRNINTSWLHFKRKLDRTQPLNGIQI